MTKKSEDNPVVDDGAVDGEAVVDGEVVVDDVPSDPPEQTRDDTDEGWGQSPPDCELDPHERWLQEQRPPHWG